MWPFRKRVITPMFPVVEQMRRKDPDLFAKVAPLSVGSAIREWRKVYPEDFAEKRSGEQ